MYRQVDKNRNCFAMTVEEFPDHIQRLLKQIREKEERDRLAREKENNTFKLKIYCCHPLTNQLIDTKIFVFRDTTLAEAASDAYDAFKLTSMASLEDCRLVMYNKIQDCIDYSFDKDDYKFSDIQFRTNNDWFLEIRQPGVPFEVYKSGGVRMKVYLVNLDMEEVKGPTNIRINAGETVHEVKIRLGNLFNMDPDFMQLAIEAYSNEPRHLDEETDPIKFDPSCNGYKLYVSKTLDEDPSKVFAISKMHKIIDRFVHVITIDIVLPENDIGK